MRYPQRRSDVRVHELDGEALIFDPVSADTHRLNETALFVWRHCDGRHSAGQVAQKLTQAYDVSVEVAVECVMRVVDQFESSGLLLARVDGEADGT
jgi:hypothetical protein